VPQRVPVETGDQPVMLRLASQTWQALVGFGVPAGTHIPAMLHTPIIVTFEQRAASSSQLSVVQLTPSSHGVPEPRHEPAPSQRSVAVQNAPSSHAVPLGALGFEQTPAVQTSEVQRSSSEQLAQSAPAAPHSLPVRPVRQRIAAASQQPAQQTPP
jgi:hypothetical protein